MELIEIDKTNLLILLNTQDRQKYAVSDDDSFPAIKDNYSRIISDGGADRSFLSGATVQIFDSENGGLQMFVTKLADARCADTDKLYIYIFRILDELLAACRYLCAKSFTGGSAYYDSDQKKYYLILNEENPHLCEFGAVRCRDFTEEYLFEHCKKISADAVTALSKLY